MGLTGAVSVQEAPVMPDEMLMNLLPSLADSSGRVATSFQLGCDSKLIDNFLKVFTVFVNTRDRQEDRVAGKSLEFGQGRRFAAMMDEWMCRVRLGCL